MRVTLDTNVLVRMVVEDEPRQTMVVEEFLEHASLIAVGLVALCEFVWVLRSVYKIPSARAADFIRTLMSIPTVEIDRSPVEAGLVFLDEGGDFADGVIAYEGTWLGGEVFVSFDKKAVNLAATRGLEARLLA